MNIVKFTRIIDIVNRLLRSRDEYQTVTFMGSFVYSYIALCEYYGLDWTCYRSVEYIEKERGDIYLDSLTMFVHEVEYADYLETLQTIYDTHVDTINATKSSIQLMYPNILSTGVDVIEIILTSETMADASIRNICWNGIACNLHDINSMQFTSYAENRAHRVLNLNDPCIQQYVFRKMIMEDIYQKNATIYAQYMAFPKLLIDMFRLSMHEGFKVNVDLQGIRIEVKSELDFEETAEDCSICKDKMGCGLSFNDRTIIRLKCAKNVLHNFHINCISKWIVENKHNCPMCRNETDSSLFEAYRRSSIFIKK